MSASLQLIDIAEDGQRIFIQSDLLFSSVIAVREAAEKAISDAQADCVIDFSRVNQADSSALSFCLCCMRLAKRLNKTLAFECLPADMASISDLVGLDHFSSNQAESGY
ncbi:lipid asymmetry maintenance protein MlaB [Neptunomonas sp.]|uniref:STAS domain-containing protein n=1 Tax=Neptunomonas TaxID=75687 RepID=UPI00351157B9